MRIFAVTQEEPFYLPSFFQRLIEARQGDIIGLAILARMNTSLLSMAWRHYSLYGPKDFLVQSFLFAYCKFLNALSKFITLGKFYSVAAVARHYSTPVYRPPNINAPAFLDTLANLKPDLIVSVAASQVFKKDFLQLPRYGSINVHSSPLPKYRGMLPTFWVLANGERETAVTVHYMNEMLDDGDIILQTLVPIASDDTLHSLIAKCKIVGANLLLQAVDQIEEGTVTTKPNKAEQGTYFSFPTKKDVEKLKGMGRNIR